MVVRRKEDEEGPAAGEPLLGEEGDIEAFQEARPSMSSWHAVHVAWSTIIIAAGLALVMTSRLWPLEAQDAKMLFCSAKYGGEKLTVLMVADPGHMSGTHEATYYLKQMSKVKDIPLGETGACMSITKGVLLGQHVLVITTGIGPMSAASCMLELVHCGHIIKDVIFSGSSGSSPQVGGVLDPDNCTEANGGEIMGIGDVCVTPFSVNFDCHKSTWESDSKDYPNICNLPGQEAGPDRADLFGDCIYTGSVALADEILAASRKLKYLDPSEAAEPHAPAFPGPKTQFYATVARDEGVYWGAMSAGTGRDYKLRKHPHVWNYTVCTEVNTQFFFSGSPYETRARNYSATTINQAKMEMGLTYPNRTMREVIAVGDMESVGYMAVLERYNQLAALGAAHKPIPFTSVRAKSNHNIAPIQRAPQQPGVWQPQAHPPFDNFTSGYGYAIQSYSAVVLGLMYERCRATGVPEESCYLKDDWGV
mmetsp:Transcript_8826/g.29203  ORF Transcript_8826/g.29203 Transcript_8826/m.29203 type:complete len:478 (+) Transcript_8826:283-1716(+)